MKSAIVLASLFSVSVMGCASTPAVKAPTIFALEDIAGDSGEERDAPDLVRLTAYPAPGGTMFEATFARGVRRELGARRNDPYQNQNRAVVAPPSSVVLNEFSGIQLDIYIDMEGGSSGFRSLLPDSGMVLKGSARWEKAISLVSDPIEARSSLRRYLMANSTNTSLSEERRELESRLRGGMDPIVYHPDVAEVQGDVIRFLVPTRVLGGPARAEWGYAAVVHATGRPIEDRSTSRPRPHDPRLGGRIVDVLGVADVSVEAPLLVPSSLP